MTFCFHLSFSLSLFISTFPFLKVWLTAASREGECTFAFSDFGSHNLEIWQMGGIEVMDHSPSTFLHPQTSDQGENAKYSFRNLIVPNTHFKIQNTAKTLCSWLTSISAMPLLTSSNTCSRGEIGPIFWQSDPKMHWFGTTQYIILKNFIWSRFRLRPRLDVFHIFVCKWFLLFLPLQRGSLFFSIARL